MSSKPSRRAGGQSGNANALKHGLYARHFTPEERRLMDCLPPLEATQEIHLLRLTLDRILTLIETCQDEDRRVKLYNSLYLGAQRLITALRTQTILGGEDKELLTAFWDAMELFRREQNI